MILALAPLHVELEIIKVMLEETERKRFEKLGIKVGSKITILDSTNVNLIIFTETGRVALDKSIATKILVR